MSWRVLGEERKPEFQNSEVENQPGRIGLKVKYFAVSHLDNNAALRAVDTKSFGKKRVMKAQGLRRGEWWITFPKS